MTIFRVYNNIRHQWSEAESALFQTVICLISDCRVRLIGEIWPHISLFNAAYAYILLRSFCSYNREKRTLLAWKVDVVLRPCNKRKPPCIGGMELVLLSCNRVFISAESAGRGWCIIAIATKWYQFHTTDKCGFLFMPWITNQYLFVRYTKLVSKVGTAVAKVITFLIMTYTQYDMPPNPTRSKNYARYFTCRIGMATLWSACAVVRRVNKWFADDVLRSV